RNWPEWTLGKPGRSRLATGECVDAQGWRFEVVDLDGRRIDKLIATRLPDGHRPMARR
ncbi:MAG: hypothetical protein E5X10_22280, partial [Mesorhizobium sp.]